MDTTDKFCDVKLCGFIGARGYRALTAVHEKNSKAKESCNKTGDGRGLCTYKTRETCK